MKKKIVIEVTETNNRMDNMWDRKNYPSSGFHINTDELDIKSLILVPQNIELSPFGINDPSIDKDIELLTSEVYGEQELKESGSSIDSDTLLKAIAIAQNPELIKDLK